MKKLLQRVFGIAVSAALLVTSGMTAFAKDHNHHSEDKTLVSPTDGYTITLTTPSGYVTPENMNQKKFGAYQIFSGTVKGGETIEDPGDEYKKIPITDIKWGNAFGTDEDAQKNIIKFVFALAEAPTGYYKYAFSEFTGFEDFVKDGKLSAEYLIDATKEVTVTKGTTTKAIGKDSTVNENWNNVNFDKLAIGVSDVIADNHNNREWLQSFTDILGGYGTDYQEGNFVSQCYGKNGTLAADPSSSDGTYKYEIKVPAGYYMIMDLSTIDYDAGTDDSDAYSARMLFVANDITQKIKESVPTLDKKILRADDAVGTAGNETDVAGVGDVVHFQLKGSLPSNYDNYLGGYQYTFEDTLSKGLDLVQYADGHADYIDAGANDCVKISIKGVFKYDISKKDWVWDSEKTSVIVLDRTTVVNDYVTEDSPHLKDINYNYNATYDSTNRKLTVTFPCLREIRIKESDGTVYRLGYNTDGSSEASSQIYVDYYAKVNKDAVVSPKKDENENGNFNTAQIQYSNNPQSYNDMDYTVVDRATVYTFGLDITKIDAADFLRNDGKKDEATLAGVKFVLVRPTASTLAGGKTTESTTWEIAKFAEVSKETVESMPEPVPNLPTSFKENGYYTITEWTKIGDDKKGTTFNEEWLSEYISEGKEGYEITTLSNGVLNVSGIDVDVTYTMIETEAPEKDHNNANASYAKIAPFTIKIGAAKATGEEYSGCVADNPEISNTITGSESFSFENFVELLNPKTGSSDTEGTADMLVANFKYVDLPSTGGVGTYWFYILGAGGLAMSFVLFRLSKKKVA